VPFIQAEDGYINLLESDIASDKGSALLDEFVKLCEEYELNTWNVEKIITMFPDVSIDDFIYIYRKPWVSAIIFSLRETKH
jgi:poly-beta-hydroxyalkanoate depolymerase